MAETQGQGKVALVIGAGDATGGAIAARFAKEGYIACLTRRSADKLQPTVDAIRAARCIAGADHQRDFSLSLHLRHDCLLWMNE